MEPQHITLEGWCNEIGAVEADIPGLWNVPGHPELTTGQLLVLFLAQQPRAQNP